MMRFWSHIGLVALLGVLVACPVTEPRPEYRLNSILPAPVTPGDMVTAFGVLPQTATVTLNGLEISATKVSGGWQFAIPNSAVAGDAKLEIAGDGATLTGVISVNPRVDAVVLDADTLRIRGAGWGETGDLKGVVVSVQGLQLIPTRDATGLRVVLPSIQAYGTLRVSVTVSERTSDARGVAFEAGAVSGSMVLPAVSPLQTRNARVQQPAIPDLKARALLVFTAPENLPKNLLGILKQNSSSTLGVSRLEFETRIAAEKALNTLQNSGLKVIWDGVAQLTEVGDVTPEPAPRKLTRSSSRLAGDWVVPAEQWYLPLEGIPAAWQHNTGAGVVVAVVDTGVDLVHPDLKDNVLPGYDFVDDDADPQDEYGHGTHVAGLIAARGKIYGVAPNAKILPVRVIRDRSGGSSFTIANGILWSAGLLEGHPNPNPAKVINLSLGSDSTLELIGDAIQKVTDAGVLVIAAAGNNGSGLAFPASMPQVMAVTALAGPKIQYQPFYASKGNNLFITAFGGDSGQDQDQNGTMDGIYSTDLTPSGYGLRMGTSMASPQVAGLAALALSSGIPSNVIHASLAGTTTDVGAAGYDLQFGFGLMSGRTVNTPNPRVYAAVFTKGKLVSISLVQSDNSFLVGNIPPSSTGVLTLVSDNDNDGIAGEAGDRISSPMLFESKGGVVSNLGRVSLAVASGLQAFSLEIK